MIKNKHKKSLLSTLFISILLISTSTSMPLQIELTKEGIFEIKKQ